MVSKIESGYIDWIKNRVHSNSNSNVIDEFYIINNLLYLYVVENKK